MHKHIVSSLLLLSLTGSAFAQQPGRPPESRDDPRNEQRGSGDSSSFVARMLTLDKDRDGKLSKSEVTDARLQAIFERADADKNGEVTKDELAALFQKESEGLNQGRGFGMPPEGGPGGRPQGRGPGGPQGGPPGGGPDGGPGNRGFGGFPLPGQIFPPFLRDELKLSDEQRKQLDDLQKQVDQKLSEILTDSQRRQLQEFRQRAPGGRRD